MATTFWQAFFSELWISLFLIKSNYFYGVSFTFLYYFRVNLLILIILDQIWRFLKVWEKSRNPRWRIQDGRRLRTKHYCDVMWRYQLMLRTSVETFWAYYLSFKFRCHSLNILGVKRWGWNPPPPGPTRAKKARTEYRVKNCAYYIFTLRKTVLVLVMLVTFEWCMSAPHQCAILQLEEKFTSLYLPQEAFCTSEIFYHSRNRFDTISAKYPKCQWNKRCCLNLNGRIWAGTIDHFLIGA